MRLLFFAIFVLTAGAIDLYANMDNPGVIEDLAHLELNSSYTDLFAAESKSSIVVILNQFKRNNSLAQLNAVVEQSLPVDKVFVYQNEAHVDLSFLPSRLCRDDDNYPRHCLDINIVQSKDFNFKYHGRFTIPLLLDTDFVAIFDDDVIPGPLYLENCIRVVTSHNAICGASGQILAPDRKVGVFPPTSHDVEVDSASWSWVFKRAWIRYFWAGDMPTFSQAEDISFGMSLWLRAGIRSVVARQADSEDRADWGARQHTGDDDHASYKQTGAGMMRWAVNLYWIEQGYVPLAVRSRLTNQSFAYNNSNSSYCNRTGIQHAGLDQFPLQQDIPASSTLPDVAVDSSVSCQDDLCSHLTHVLDLMTQHGYLPNVTAMSAGVCSVTEAARRFITVEPRNVQQTLFLR